MNRLLEKAYSTIKAFSMIKRDSVVCVALSGGPDSMALLHIISKLKSRLGVTVTACHYDHAFRADSSADMDFAVARAKDLDIKIATDRNINGKPDSRVQVTARHLRYTFFEKLLSDGFADIIATAHTMDDSVETSIMWAMRGAGPSAFGGIAPVRDKYIRPLIEVRKSELLDWLGAEGIEFRIDPSNETDDYMRNRVRRYIIPTMENEEVNAVPAIYRLTRLTSQQSIEFELIVARWIDSFVTSRSFTKVVLAPEPLADQSEVFRMSVYRLILGSIGANVSSISFERLGAIDKLVLSGSLGKGVELTGDYVAWLDHEGLAIRKRVEPQRSSSAPFVSAMQAFVGDGMVMVKPVADGSQNDKLVDIGKIPDGAMFRTRRAGDFLRLNNVGGKKTVKIFFIDRKIPSGKRNSIAMLVDGSEVLWVPDLFMAPSILADENSIKLAVISYEAKDQ